MPKALMDALASSSAHGISKAAGTKAAPLKVMWILLFLSCLAMFLKSGISLVMKLQDNTLTKVYHMDQVPFVFPDLYFCPSNPYSGSYPFLLTRSEAEQVNSEISRIIGQYEKLMGDFRNPTDVFRRVFYVQTSFPFDLTVKHLILRSVQSILRATVTSEFVSYGIELEPFFSPENLICFKALLTDELKQKLMAINSVLEIWLLSDPYFSDFNFTGHPIRPIVDGRNNSVSFLSWHPTRIVEQLKVSGFTMLIVPPGAFPSMRFENNFHLAPGNAYSVKLKMEENACSEELHSTHCVYGHPQIGFRDPLSGKRAFFNYSSAACYYMRRNSMLTDILGCQMSMQPLLWKFRNSPRCLNASEITVDVIAKLRNLTIKDIHKLELDAVEYCSNKIPCYYPQYTARYSFGKWPSAGSSTDNFFATNDFSPVDIMEAPIIFKLAEIARKMQNGTHSAHLEGIFRSYVSESMVRVSISAASIKSSQVMLTWSYSLPDFLADTGGLLGLYIGCSLLTMCELFELMYVLVDQVFKRRSREETSADAGETPKPDNQMEDASNV